MSHDKSLFFYYYYFHALEIEKKLNVSRTSDKETIGTKRRITRKIAERAGTQARIMCGNVFEWCIILPPLLPAGSRSGGPILFLKISRKRRAFQGGAAPALNHPARRSHQRLTSDQQRWPPVLWQWVSVPGSCHHRRNQQPHTVTYGDTRFIANVLARAANKFLFGRRTYSNAPIFIRFSSPLISLSYLSRFTLAHYVIGSYLICCRVNATDSSADLDSLSKLAPRFRL
jgi:hypothetical protein